MTRYATYHRRKRRAVAMDEPPEAPLAITRPRFTGFLGILLLLATTGAALAAEDDSFFDGKTITYIVGTKPGGGYDTYARLIGKYLERYLPGAEVVVENVPGAGHIIAANRLYVTEPDGLTIGTLNTGLIYAQLLAREGVQFDLRKLSWIGKAASDPRVFVVGSETGLASIDDVRRARGTLLGTTGIGSASHNDLSFLTAALDLDVELIAGYSGQEVQLAILRGEVAGALGSYSSFRSFVAEGQGSILLHIGGDGLPELSQVPSAQGLVTDPDDRAIVDLIETNSKLGRMTAGPPGIDPVRLATLRRAYDAALADRGLLDEAARIGRPIAPASGATVAHMVDAAISTRAATIISALNQESP